MRGATIGAVLLAALTFGSTSLIAPPATAQGQLTRRSFKDCSDCPEMVRVPAGTFIMGVPPGEDERENAPRQYWGWSAPQHPVTIREGFAIGKFDITVEEFAAFVRDAGHSAGNSCWQPRPVVALRKLEWQLLIGRNWEHPGFAQTTRHPVVCVSWDDAKAYVAWLSTKAKRPYRLPTEAEWEYAARAGSSTARFWGDGRADACRYANVSGVTKLKTAQFPPAGDRFFFLVWTDSPRDRRSVRSSRMPLVSMTFSAMSTNG